MKSIIQKGIIPARTQFQDKKFQTSRPCEVRRSGQVTTFVVCAVLSISFQAVVLSYNYTVRFILPILLYDATLLCEVESDKI